MAESNFENTVGFFVGKELSKQGITKAGKEWVQYKLWFKNDMANEKKFGFTAFIPLTFSKTLQVEQLKEGTQYRILFTPQNFIGREGIPVTSKKALAVYEHQDAPNKPIGAQTQANPSNIPSKVDLSQFEAFKGRYLALMKERKMELSAVHMLGSYIATYEKERVAELVQKCINSCKEETAKNGEPNAV